MSKLKFTPDSATNNTRSDLSTALAASVAPDIEQKIQLFLQGAGDPSKVSVRVGALGDIMVDITTDSKTDTPSPGDLFTENIPTLDQGAVSFKNMEALGAEEIQSKIDKIVETAMNEVMENLPDIIAKLGNPE